MTPKAKVITVSYGILSNPNNRKIAKAIEKWSAKGYRLSDQQEIPSGCFLIPGGKTRLTFIKDS